MTKELLLAYFFSKTTIKWTIGLTLVGVIVLTAFAALLANTYGLWSGGRVQIEFGSLLTFLQKKGPRIALRLLPNLLLYNYLRVVGVRSAICMVKTLWQRARAKKIDRCAAVTLNLVA